MPRRYLEETMSENPQEVKSERLPFNAEFIQRVNDFSQELLTAIPELHGLALVPLWNVQPENASSGVLRLRNPQPPFLPSLMQLLKRLAAFNVDVQRDLVGQLQMYDNYAAELSTQIKARIEELEKLKPENTPNA
jgi:hypothetical protein